MKNRKGTKPFIKNDFVPFHNIVAINESQYHTASWPERLSVK